MSLFAPRRSGDRRAVDPREADWALELERLALPPDQLGALSEAEFDPETGEPVTGVPRPRPWFRVTEQDKAVHGGQIQTDMSKKERHQ